MSARTDAEAESNQASSGVTPQSLADTLRAQLGATHVDIHDMSGIARLTGLRAPLLC